jgi:hypothetical protein
VGATVSTANAEGAEAVASDLRLNLTLGVRYITQIPISLPFIDRAYACSPAPPSGFDDEISELSLTCDKPIRGFAAGQNILTTSADVFWIGEYAPETSITLGQWLELMNKGETNSMAGHYGEFYEWANAYDVSIAFIPEGTDAASGNYNFTFSMEMQSGKIYNQTFDPVSIAALP